MRPTVLLATFLASAGVFLACSATVRQSPFEDPNQNGGNGTVGGGTLGGGGGGDGGKPCVPAAGNWDIPGNNCDDDGDGTADNPPTCDVGLEQDGSAEDFARAMGICANAAKDGYGLVSAKFTRGHTSTTAARDEQHGILDKFGDVLKPREGVRLGVLSTGFGREYDSLNGNANFAPGREWGFDGDLPDGYPKAASGCDQGTETKDVINLVLTLKAPKNASGVRFDFNFFSSEWPAYICSEFNDGFIAYLSAKGFNGGKPDNMSFDKDKNPVSVNNGFFDRCTPGAEIGCAPDAKPGTSVCPGGVAELRGTGYGVDGPWCGPGKVSTNGGATGWLTSSAPVQPGEEFTLELMIWDTGDARLDSSVLLDKFAWAEGEVTVATDRPR